MVVLVACKSEEDPIKNEGALSVDKTFLIITLWELSGATKPEFRSDRAKNLMQPFPYPNYASDKI